MTLMMLLSFISIWQKVLIHRHEEKRKKKEEKSERQPHFSLFSFINQSIHLCARAHFFLDSTALRRVTFTSSGKSSPR